tara:strand:- start:15968 stop:18643 length:2676 start_codon:yes stop_codon:yes gene_type:complete
MHEFNEENLPQSPPGRKEGGPSDKPDDASNLQDATVLSSGEKVAPMEGSHARTSDLGRVLEGQQLNHFRLDAFVGGGGMGAVFRGTDTALGRTVAIKVLLQQYSDDEETTQRFQNEAQSTARLDHDNIARVYYVGEDRGWHYIVLEFIDGDNLRDLVYRHGPLSLENAVHYTLQISDALQHASSRDVVHRDIKPSNVLIGRDGHLKLVDMGLARLHQVDKSQEDLTATGVTLGTFDYISPEQARDPRNADVRSDLYSLGCTLYFMLTAEPPFPEGTVLQKLLQHQGDSPPDPQIIRPDLPLAICDITQKLLAKNPRDRYQNPLELSADLLLLANQLDFRSIRNSSVIVTPVGLNTSWTARHLPWIVPTGLLVLIGLFIHYTSRPIGPLEPPRPLPKFQVAPFEIEDYSTGRQTANDANSNGRIDRPEMPNKRNDVPSIPPLVDSRKVDPASQEGNVASNAKISNPILPQESVPQKKDNETEQLLRVANGLRPGAMTSLNDACREATSGSVIELDYTGRLEEPENPILLTQRKLTIRAGEGHQPIVYFRPLGPDRTLYPRSMITLTGGSLTLVNVHLVLEIPSHARSEGWTIFETVLAENLRLERCTMTIRNAAEDFSAMYRDISFFHVKSPPGKEFSQTQDPAPMATRLEIELRNCVVRGEADFLRGDALYSADIQWENGLLATTERFVRIDGQTASLPEDQRLTIDLKHVTASTEKGLCLMESSSDQRRLTSVQIDCTDSILMTQNTPLIKQVGPQTEEEFRKLIEWNADRCFYENFDVFWEIDSLQSDDVNTWEWNQWLALWEPTGERNERPAAVLWSRRSRELRATSDHQLSDYLLLPDDENPARNAATDGMSDAGFQFATLPETPAPTDKFRNPDRTTSDDLPTPEQ